MSPKGYTIGLIVFFVLVSFGCQEAKESYQPYRTIVPANQTMDAERVISDPDANRQSGREQVSHTVIAYYFHPTFRCQACLDIESLSSEAIGSGFEKAIENDDLIWVVLNMEEPGAEKFVEEFKLDTSTLVIADMHGAEQTRWKKLEKVWELLDDRGTFIKYVQKEVAEYLNGD